MPLSSIKMTQMEDFEAQCLGFRTTTSSVYRALRRDEMKSLGLEEDWEAQAACHPCSPEDDEPSEPRAAPKRAAPAERGAQIPPGLTRNGSGNEEQWALD